MNIQAIILESDSDRIVVRFGPKAIVIGGSLIAAAGLALASLVPLVK